MDEDYVFLGGKNRRKTAYFSKIVEDSGGSAGITYQRSHADIPSSTNYTSTSFYDNLVAYNQTIPEEKKNPVYGRKGTVMPPSRNSFQEMLLENEISNHSPSSEYHKLSTPRKKHSTTSSPFFRNLTSIKSSSWNLFRNARRMLNIQIEENSYFLLGRNKILDMVKFDKVLRWKNVQITVFALLGLLCSIATLLLNWDFKRGLLLYDGAISQDELIQYVFYQVIKIINILITCITLMSVMEYYRIRCEQKCREWGYSNRFHAFLFTSLKWKCLAECILVAITPIPFLEKWAAPQHFFSVDVDRLPALWMFTRIYFVLRMVRDFSETYQKRFAIMLSNAKVQALANSFSIEITLRILLYQHTLVSIFMGLLGSVLIGSFGIYISERDEPGTQLKSFFNCIYYSIITITTIGFGDMVAVSNWGKVFTVMTGFVGIVIVTLFTGVMINKIQPSREQKYAVEFLKIEHLLEQRLKASVSIVQAKWLFKKKYCNRFYMMYTTKENIKKLRYVKQQLMDLTGYNPIATRRVAQKASTHSTAPSLDIIGPTVEVVPTVSIENKSIALENDSLRKELAEVKSTLQKVLLLLEQQKRK